MTLLAAFAVLYLLHPELAALAVIMAALIVGAR